MTPCKASLKPAACQREKMDKRQLAYFKRLLNDWLNDLLRHADDTVIGLRSSAESLLPDPLDQATYDLERNFQLRIRDRESILINKIRRSLNDIENGTYGICEICEEEISVKRLEARPVARQCIKCKTALESKEKLTGT
jgi:DnaK suppressor protein